MRRLSLAALMALMIAVPAFAAPLGNGFTYQGELKLSGSPVNVTTDFQFSLWDAPGAGCPTTGGTQLGATQTVFAQTVTDGRFTVILNAAGEFGATAFDGNARWLQIAVRSPAGGGAYTTLCPRQAVTATPFALKVPGIDGHSLDAADGSPVDALVVDNAGNVGIGTPTPTSLLHVNGTARMNGLLMPTGAGAGKLLTSDGSGNATWQTGAGGSLTLPFSGTASTGGSAFMVTNNGIGDGLNGVSAGNGTGVYGEGTVGVWGRSPDFEGTPRGAGPGYAGLYGESGDSGNGVVGDAGPYGYGVRGRAGDSGAGVHGTAGTAGSGVYGIAGPSGKGVYGRASVNGYGVYGDGTGLDLGIGVYGIALGPPPLYRSYSVYGYNQANTADAWAGYFDGRVYAYILHTAAGVSKIDHPLDPENQYLNHAFVESPDMKNIYDGNAVLDRHGEAVVEMPEWFEALNRDFRYQLTALGAPAPGLYVAQEVSNRRFRIAGGAPGLKVSWQLTGIRQDMTANANRIQVEESKSLADRGRYLDPKAFGLPEERSVDYERRMRARQLDPLARGAIPKK